jgi:hypothetical protein
VVFTGLVGAIGWNLLTWYFGLPSSSSHADIGGVVGAAFVAKGAGAVNGTGILAEVVVPALVAPFLAAAVAALGTRTASSGAWTSPFRAEPTGMGRWPPAPSCRFRTAPTTPRRPWESSSWRWSRAATCPPGASRCPSG